MEKIAAMSQKYSPGKRGLRKPLTTAAIWHAQYSVNVNKGWARIPGGGLSIFYDGPKRGKAAGPDGAKRGIRLFANNTDPSG
jgi:hypothetical protein